MPTYRFGSSVSVEQVTDEMRARAKTISLGIIYGMGHESLAQKLSTPQKVVDKRAAAALHNSFLKKVGHLCFGRGLEADGARPVVSVCSSIHA